MTTACMALATALATLIAVAVVRAWERPARSRSREADRRPSHTLGCRD